jgi:hypothetical protein
MAVQQEIKSNLAKLLATEDLVVEHKSVPTAQFNVHTRVLTLPIWEKASHDVYDMLVGHEVAHALFTPDEDWTEKIQVPQQFVNVCEDARVEKLMKRKYMGIAKTFYNGYNELNEQDFFEIEDEDITTFNLADRINLFYKVGSFVDLAFSDTEKEIVDLVGAAETFDEMLSASKVLYEYCKKVQEQEAKIDLENQSKQGELELDMGNVPSEGEGEEGDTENSPQPTPQMEESGGTQGDLPELEVPSEPEVQTADALQDNIQSLVNQQGEDNVYVEIPTINVDKIVVSNAEVHQVIDASWKEQKDQWSKSEYHFDFDLFTESDNDYVQFKRSAQKEVSYLVKEFECRKAADNYARSATNRTGVLDTTKLHTYRFNEDIFKRITTVPDGKNHGLIFILDWSGSMSYVMQDTIKQLYNLVWFCRKVSIPFEVYAFTNEWIRYGEEIVHSRYERKEYNFAVDDTFSLLNLLSSKVNAKTLENQMINIWRLGSYFNRSYHSYYTTPQQLNLSGTPLNEAILCLHKILPQFQKENNVQKVQCIVLTDGEANHLPYHKMVTRYRYRDGEESSPYMGMRRINPATSFLRDRKVGKTYKFGWSYSDFTSTLITNLKDRFPTVNFIGIRLLENRDAMRFAKMYYREYSKEYEVVKRDWKKQKSYTIHNSGYDAYFAMSSSNLSDDAEFEVEDDATKAQIKRAFVKSLKTKKLNKKVLGEFISLVA